jgi:2-polyprenyl-3-methyl-5-hydroxy-6-metoxy-1,4-benzoquinol methylase
MNKLTIQEYNTLEQESLANTSNFSIEAFAPAGFQITNYPDRIYHENELWRYMDVMQENTYMINLYNLGNNLSQFEYEITKKVILKFKHFGMTLSGKLYFKSGLSKQLQIFRVINNIFGEKKISIFELGPGSGFLAALLATAGHKIYCLDNSQAFYIYQNHFWQEFGINEWAREDERYEDNNNIIHIPWWLWANTEFEMPKIDIVVANAVLNEMKSNALKYTLSKVNDAIDEKGMLFYSQSGETLVSKYETTKRTLYSYGWFLQNTKRVHIFSREDIQRNISLVMNNKFNLRQYRFWINFLLYYAGKAPFYIFQEIEVESLLTELCCKNYKDFSIDKINELFETTDGIGPRTPDEKFCELIGSFDLDRFQQKIKYMEKKKFKIKLSG